jgi:hypothetical protein
MKDWWYSFGYRSTVTPLGSMICVQSITDPHDEFKLIAYKTTTKVEDVEGAALDSCLAGYHNHV